MRRASMRVLARGGAVLAGLALALGPVGPAHADRPTDPGRQERTEQAGQGPTQGCDGSHHSATGHGANTDGRDNPYHNTCDGSPSGNGSNRGESKGRPCAGCVGNADDKNPPGQAPGGADRNAGYECDRNHGVGRTNPAHTGCAAAAAPLAPARCPNGTAMTDVNRDGTANAADCVAVGPAALTCPTGLPMTVDADRDGDVDAADCVAPAVTCPDGSAMTVDRDGDGEIDAADCVRVAGVGVDRLGTPGGPAGDGTGTGTGRLVPAEVAGTKIVRGGRPVAVGGVTLPVTGGQAQSLLVVGAVLLAAGVVLAGLGTGGRAAPTA